MKHEDFFDLFGSSKSTLSFTLLLGSEAQNAVRTLSELGLQHLSVLRPLFAKFGNVLVIDSYHGTVGTIDLRDRQRGLFDALDRLEQPAVQRITDALGVLTELPWKSAPVWSLERLEATRACDDWELVAALARAAKSLPGETFRCEDRAFELPAALAGRVQTEFVSSEVLSLPNCIVITPVEEGLVELECRASSRADLPKTFEGHVAPDSLALKTLRLAWALAWPVRLVRVRRARSVFNPKLFAYVEDVESGGSWLTRALNVRLPGLSGVQLPLDSRDS